MMKNSLSVLCLISTLLSFSFSVQAQPEQADSLTAKTSISNTALLPKNLLLDMQVATENLTYEMAFVQATSLNIESFKYRHVNVNNKSYSQQFTLDGSHQEILQQGNLISYLAMNNASSFAIKSRKIIDNLPNILHANINDLSKYYDFVPFGRNRIADRLVQVVRLMPKDNFRYQYILFIDDHSHLLLGSDMLNSEGLLLERFRVVNLHQNLEEEALKNYIETHPIPTVIENKNKQTHLKWKPNWLPVGFKLINQQIDSLDATESQLYSDSLFSFTIYVSDTDEEMAQANQWRQDSYTIYSEVINGKEITIIGQIPLNTAKRIVQEIQL